jgi:hypothetical protein
MPGFISKPHGEDLDFELFSNIVLKFTAILMVVLVLLAINVGQRLDQIISTNRFSGGLARPMLYLGAYAVENVSEGRKLAVGLLSASFAAADTYVSASGTTVTRDDTETISGRYYDTPYFILELLAGISPGSIIVDGKQTPFVIPNFVNKALVYEDKDKKTRRAAPSEQLAKRFLKLWSNSYANPVYPTRAFAEYKNTKTLVNVETSIINGQHYFLIGNRAFSTAQIKRGRLDFLTSLSSTNTEIVYLGDFARDGAKETSARLEFYEKNGFVDAAKHARSHQFPGAAERDLARDYYNLLTSWDQLSPDRKSDLLNSANGDVDLARSRYETANTERAFADYSNGLLQDAIVNDVTPDLNALPNVSAYPDAWQAYVAFRSKLAPTPPDWFVSEFLQPLGFDKRVTIIE